MKTTHQVKVVVPVYRDHFDEQERMSVRQTLRMLADYPIVFLLPDALTPPREIEDQQIIRVSEEWLGTRNGIAGYNRMLLSKDFYELFADCEYILICQTDVWIFRDELRRWCDRGYDYVGAPWPKRPVYDLFLVRWWLRLRKWWFGRRGRPLRQDRFDRVGNGGLSLRRCESHRQACERYADLVERYGRGEGHMYNEDVFWALVPQEFRYPSVEEAMAFSFDIHPAYCYRVTDGQLPFGCHGWHKRRRYKFWKTFIR